MLSSIRDKLLTVKKNVALFGGPNEKPPDFSSAAGTEILTHFQKDWAELQANSETNAKLADDLSLKISEVCKKVDRDKESLGLMTHLLSNSNLKMNITNCAIQIKQLYETFEKVEKELVELEDLIETVTFENRKKQHKYHLDQYKIRKEDSLANLEKTLKENYEKRLVEYEAKKKTELQERQQVFHEAFKSDLEAFKNFGTIPKLDLPKKQPSALLEEIQIDYDEGELNQFFEDQPSSSLH